MRIAVSLVALCLLGGCATPEEQAQSRERGERDLARVLEGRVAGPPQRCINPSNFSGAQPVGDSILFRNTNRRIWRSQVAANCPAFRQDGDQIIINIVNGGQLCSGDQFRLLDRGTRIPSAFCRYSEFVPYEKLAR